MIDPYCLAVGTMSVSGFFNGLMVLDRDPDESTAFYKEAVGAGFELYDTAPIYGRGMAEADLGHLVPSDARIWTKAGVDIEQPFPRLDYSVAGMMRSVGGSLNRLRRDRVELVLVHNPAASIVDSIDFEAFAMQCVDSGHGESVGVSVLDPSTTLPALASRLTPGSVIMCEVEQLNPDDHATLSILGDFRLALRSILGHGARLRNVPTYERLAAIEQRISDLRQAFMPETIVIGARTVEQLRQYRPAGTAAGEPRRG